MNVTYHLATKNSHWKCEETRLKNLDVHKQYFDSTGKLLNAYTVMPVGEVGGLDPREEVQA